MVINNDKLVTVGVSHETRDIINSRAEQGTQILIRQVTANEVIKIMSVLIPDEKLISTFKKIKKLEEKQKQAIYGGIE